MSRLTVAAVPIDGKWNILDPRVVYAVKSADILIAEEKKTAHRILAACDERDKTFKLINEHTTIDERNELFNLILAGCNAILISDAGTPCIADPDYRLVSMCHDAGVEIGCVPGASSITSALSVSGFNASKFIYLGFPPKEGKDRKDFFEELDKLSITAVFMERPYVLERTLKDLIRIKRKICVCMNIGGKVPGIDESEIILRGTSLDICNKLGNMKGSFTIVIESK